MLCKTRLPIHEALAAKLLVQQLLFVQERQDYNFNIDCAVPNDTVDPDIVRERYVEVSLLKESHTVLPYYA